MPAKTFKDALEEDALVFVQYGSGYDDSDEVKFFLQANSGHGELLASIEIEYLSTASFVGGRYGDCLDAYQVTWSEAERGYGPLIYDLAMEYATREANGLTCDRAIVSKDAYKVWLTYLRLRGDVVKQQLDDPNNTLTPTDKDNCAMDSVKRATDKFGGLPFPQSPLAKVYKKTNQNVTKAFKKHGRWRIQSSDIMDLDTRL